MDRIVRREFKGSRPLFFLLWLSIIGIPRAVLYLVEETIEVHYEIEDAEAFLRQHFGQDE